MEKTKYCPVLDYDFIVNNIELFSCINDFSNKYKDVKNKIFKAGCKSCTNSSIKNEFAQFVRNEIVEKKIKSILIKLDSKMIIRYGKKIHRPIDFI